MYKVTLIKDYGPHKTGELYGLIDIDGYTKLYNLGYIDDELNLMEKKEIKKVTKSKKEKTEKKEDNNNNNLKNI